jgi:hypothetical protein
MALHRDFPQNIAIAFLGWFTGARLDMPVCYLVADILVLMLTHRIYIKAKPPLMS